MRRITRGPRPHVGVLHARAAGGVADERPPTRCSVALRVRRWDQGGLVKIASGGTVTDLDATGATGLITVPASGAGVVLEHGVTVALTSPGGVPSAPETTGSSPRAPATPSSRSRWRHRAGCTTTTPGSGCSPPARSPTPTAGCCGRRSSRTPGCGDCTVCVSAEGHNSGDFTIQDAVDQVAQDGGTVCLGAGTFRLDEAVRVEKVRGVEVHGQGGGDPGAGRGRRVRGGAQRLRDASRPRAGLCRRQREPTPTATRPRRPGSGWPAAGGPPWSGSPCWSPPTRASPAEPAVKLHDLVLLSCCRDSFLAGPVCVAGWADPEPPLLLFGFTVAGNTLAGSRHGVALDGLVAHGGDTEVVDNLVIGSAEAGISLTGVKLPPALLAVDGNEIGVRGHGVVVGSSGAEVTGNAIVGGWDDERETTGPPRHRDRGERGGRRRGQPTTGHRQPGVGLRRSRRAARGHRHRHRGEPQRGDRRGARHRGHLPRPATGSPTWAATWCATSGLAPAPTTPCHHRHPGRRGPPLPRSATTPCRPVGGLTERPQSAYGIVLLGVHGRPLRGQRRGRRRLRAPARARGTDYSLGGVWG